MTTTKGSRRIGLILAAAGFLTVAGLLTTAPATALPTGAKKIGMVCSPGSAVSGTHHFDLVTGTGDIQTPDGNSVFMWSYADPNDADPGLAAFQYPGPNLCVTQGETVEIHLHNTLSEPSSIVFPGQGAAVTASGGSAGLLTTEAASGGDVTYSFVAGNPGTYLYESGTDPSKQIEMGLYGALIVRPNLATCPAVANSDCAYGPGTRFDPNREYLLLLAEIDPALHHAVKTGGTYDFTTKHDRYYTINGRSFPDTIQDNGSGLLPSQPYGALVRIQPTTASSDPALIRMINAGSDNHPFHPHGNHTTQIAQDGRPVARTEHFGETIGAGQTADYLLRWDNNAVDSSGASFNDNWDPVTNPLPVQQPNYRNLTFKDGNTWYSGSPYLGYKGTLPTGTNSLNICGEWYFPFHSHALNEFSNFDEGFGGMGTLLRVDPAGGCFTSPAAAKILQGTLNGGAVGALAADDAAYYKVNSTTTGTRTSDWYGQFSGVLAGSTNLKVTYKGNDTPTPPPPYTQNFNSLSTGTSSTLPSGWALSESGTGFNTSYTGNNGSSATPNTYSYGTTAGDRALGVLRGTENANNFNSYIGAAFTNTTGATINSLAINYTGEQWRKAGNGADRLDFQYSTNATTLTDGTWNDVDPLDFTSPVSTPGTATLNGNSAANRTAKSFTITGLSIGNGATYRIRWSEPARAAGVTHDGLAVDDLSITRGLAMTPVTTDVFIWNWTGGGSWVHIAGPTAVGSTDVVVANNILAPGPSSNYIGTGANKGLVRVRVLSVGGTANFVTGGNLMRLVYDAP